jgi:mRNA interferase RelE/StbE
MTASYELIFLKSFDRDLRGLDRQIIPAIVEKILVLENNPRPTQSKKLRGTHNEYRLRVGDYRIFYTIDDAKKRIILYHVAHRREAYR